MSGGGGIGSDIQGSLGLLAGGAATLMGAPEIGIPMMMGGTNSLIGGNLGGGSSGGGGGMMAPPMSAHNMSGGLSGLMGMGGPAGSPAGNAPATPALANPTSLAGVPAAPPPATLNPAGGGAANDPISGYLSAGGGGARPMGINNAGLSGLLNSPPTQGSSQGIGDALAAPNASTGGGDPSQPWYSNPAYWQGAGSVGSAYLKYLTDQKQPEFARPFGSTVTPQQLNPLAGVRSNPITPPQLVV